MKLDYFSLLSPEPVQLPGVGGIKSPTLREVARLSYPIYLTYINLFLMNKDAYYQTLDRLGELYFEQYSETEKETVLKIRAEYEVLPSDQQRQISFFHIIRFDSVFCGFLCKALQFFLTQDVAYDHEKRLFLLYDAPPDGSESRPAVGCIHIGNYDEVIRLILQRVNAVPADNTADKTKIKNKTAERLLEKIKKGNLSKQQKESKKMELGNLVSALASHSHSLNMVNIWDLTMYQFQDQFLRKRIGDIYDIQCMSIAHWGNPEGKFDDTQWFSTIYEN